MEKISISNIVEYSRKKTSGAQITFINNLNKTKDESKSDSGGDYWIHSLSTVSAVCISEKKDLLSEKIDVLNEKYLKATVKISKSMYNKNIEILHRFEDFDFSQLKPNCELQLLTRPKSMSIIIIEGLSVQVLPNHVFTYKVDKVKKIGAIWFVAKLNGYQIEELAFFTDALYRYLSANYADDYEIDPNFCLTVDAMNLNKLKYTQILNKEVPVLLQKTLKAIKETLKLNV